MIWNGASGYNTATVMKPNCPGSQMTMSAADRNKQVTGSPKAGGLELGRRTCCVPVKPPRLAGQALHRRHVLGRGRDRETREGPFILCVRCAVHSRVRCHHFQLRERKIIMSVAHGSLDEVSRSTNVYVQRNYTVLPLRSALKNSISSSTLNIHIRHAFTLGFLHILICMLYP